MRGWLVQHPDLTAVIPTYNSRAFIAETIQTVATAGPACIIVADDASTDGTAEAAEQVLAELDGETLLVRNERNLGVTANWQSAINRVQTRYCWKCDADDLVLPDYVADAVALLRVHANVVITAAQSLEVEPGSSVPDGASEAFATLRWEKPEPVILHALDSGKFLFRWNTVASATTIYRMAAWHDVGGFDLRIGYCSDHEIWFRLAKIGKIGHFPAIGAVYRVNPQSVTRTAMRNSTVAMDRSNMYLNARKLWPEPELGPLYRKQMRFLFKAHLGSFGRLLPQDRKRALRNLQRAVRILPELVR